MVDEGDSLTYRPSLRVAAAVDLGVEFSFAMSRL